MTGSFATGEVSEKVKKKTKTKTIVMRKYETLLLCYNILKFESPRELSKGASPMHLTCATHPIRVEETKKEGK